jgi:nucleoside-diphosphate-sugar epimerase
LENTIVIAGANGFMGNRCVAEALLKHAHVIALARGSKTETAEQRILTELEDNIEEYLLAPLRENLEVYEYDILKEDLGLAPDIIGAINAKATAVINFVGDTNFFPKDIEHSQRVNIEGAVNLINTLCKGKATFNHISTAYVCGDRTGTILEEELNVGQRFKNDYEQSKALGEEKVRELCRMRTIAYNVFRPSIVIRRHSLHGKIPNLNHFYSFIGLLDILRQDAQTRAHSAPTDILDVSVRFPGLKNSTLNFVDLDYAVQAVFWIALHHKENKTYHLVNPAPLTNQDFLSAVMKIYKLKGLSIVEDKESFKNLNFYERLIKRALSNYIDYFFVNPEFDDSNTKAALQDSTIAPPVFDLNYLAHATGHLHVKQDDTA